MTDLHARRPPSHEDVINPDPFMSVPEAAAWFGMSTDWVWAQIRSGQLASVRFGRYVRVRRSALEAFTDQASEVRRG